MIALSATKLVCAAMLLMVLVISAICSQEVAMSSLAWQAYDRISLCFLTFRYQSTDASVSVVCCSLHFVGYNCLESNFLNGSCHFA